MEPNLKNFLVTQKRLLIFFFALVLPLLVIAYLGFNTLSERQKSTKRILESNLWVTGESALNQLEDELLRIEEEILSAADSQYIISDTIPETQTGFGWFRFIEHTSLFQLSENYEILFPITGNDENLEADLMNVHPSRFEETLKIAESFEFLNRDFRNAIVQYQKCFSQAESRRDQAISLEGIGRCRLSQKNYSQAAESYKRLYAEYSGIYNKVGHPYGIIGLLQLYEISRYIGKDEDMFLKLRDAYKKLKDGFWKINTSSYFFFLSEIEEKIESEIEGSHNPEYETEYYLLRNTPSIYREDLKFSDFLMEEIISRIRETAVLAGSPDEQQIRRIIDTYEGRWYIMSYRQQKGPKKGTSFISGLCWDKDTLRDRIIQPVLERISTETGLSLSLQEKEDSSGLSIQLKEESLSLTLRRFPYPGKLIVIQPALGVMEKDSRKEIIIYGLMLGIIIILMTLGAVLIARDIKRESDSVNLKTEFIHNVSHELKTPLSLIRLYGETLLLKKDLPEEEKTDSLQIITKESERLSHMINNILDFSKIEMGRKEFRFQQGNFAMVIRETLDSYRYHLEKKGFEIIEDIAQDIPLMYFDRDAIEGMLVNLLSNAVKFSPEKKVLSIKLFKDEENINLKVSDAGIGIAPREILHIFDRFYRSMQKTGFESRGSGLGLTLVKHVVEFHYGSINVESTPGEGSTFTIKIPILESLPKV